MNKKNIKLQKCLIDGGKFWYREDDKYIGQRIALGKYEPYLTKMILRQAWDSIVVDVGANIGYYTVLLGKKAKKVYAFEPEKVNFEILEKNIKENKLENVKLFKMAAGSKKDKGYLMKDKRNFGNNRINNYQLRIKNYESIKIVRLDDLIKEKVDLIKIDTQGWEPEVIAGAKNLIKKYHPKIFFEWSLEMYRQAKLNYQAMWDFLEEEYGKIYYIDEYIQIYYPVKKCGRECNMWVGESNCWEQYRDFWPKKWLKRLLGRPAT